MRIVNYIFIVIILSLFGMISCNDDKWEVLFFYLDKKFYEVMLMGWNDIFIINGSGRLSVIIDDKEIVLVLCIILGIDGVIVMFCIMGFEKGNVNLIVKDDVINEMERIFVKVIDSYLVYMVGESKYFFLFNGMIMYLINNEVQDCYFFIYNNIEYEVYSDFIIKGFYLFLVVKNSDLNLLYEIFFYLILMYKMDENDILIDVDVFVKEYKFNLIGFFLLIYSVIDKFLGVDWDELVKIQNLCLVGNVIFMKM